MTRMMIAGLMGLGAACLVSAAWADTGRDLVRVCSQSASLCGSDFQSDQLAAALKANACVPADASAVQGAIAGWLNKHPRAARLESARR